MTRNPLTSQRAKAWHNLMATAINEALNDNLLDLNPHYDYLKWPGFTPGNGSYPHRPDQRFDMIICGDFFTVHLCDAGWHEVMFRVESNDTSASGWLERQTKPELQVTEKISRHSFKTKRSLLATYANMNVERYGYGLGRFRL